MDLSKAAKNIIKICVFFILNLFNSIYIFFDLMVGKIFPRYEGVIRESYIKKIDDLRKQVRHRNVSFQMYTPNRICIYRHSSFSNKEPELLEWIDRYGGDGGFFDIGANIGIYSLYYAKVHSGKVYSFEPSVFNLKQLAKNVSINKLHDQVTIITNPLSNKTSIATFINGSDDEGGALSAFGVEYDQDGKNIVSDLRYNILGFALDDLLKNNFISQNPSLIKIDVDGIEPLILKGAEKTLLCPTLKSVLIEVNETFSEHYLEVNKLMEDAGFILDQNFKDRKETTLTISKKMYNQIWIRT
jgi:FkbM family methyltransferase